MIKKIFVVFMALVMLAVPSLAMAREYIIPDSDTRQLTESELWGWSYESLGFILNEIFARHGYVFNTGGKYEDYFTQLSWYQANANPDNQTMVYNKLSAMEWYNESLVKDVRKAMSDSKNYNTSGKNYLDYITFGSGSNSGYGAVSIDFAAMSFKKDQSFKVYSAPSSASWRGANGKASVSTNGPVYVAGWENGWLLVMYDTNSGAVRVGYVYGSNINGTIHAPNLSFAYTAVTCTQNTSLTDDPVTYSSAIASLGAGTQVTYLASYYEGISWAYIETSVNGQTVRGFIPESAIR